MHIVIVNRWPRFDPAERWDNELTRYETFIDHLEHEVSYVVDENGLKGVLAVPEVIAAIECIADVNDLEQLTAVCRRLEAKVGPIDQLISLSEFNLEVAAVVRDRLDIPGPRPAEVAVYRDKVCMKQHIQAAGLAIPRFAHCTTPDETLRKGDMLGYPLILKPRGGAASIGVRKIGSHEELRAALAGLSLADHEIEQFVEGRIYHVDGFVNDAGQIVFQVVSRYLNDCLAFAQGAPLGSLTVAPSPLRREIEEFSIRCCEALRLRGTPFHLEVIWHCNEPVFLELGARVGGAEVPHLINHLFGVNLYECWLRSLAGETVSVQPRRTDARGGWLVIPKPAEAVRVRWVRSLKQTMPTIWRELLPKPGEVLAPGGAYDALHCGRFILVGDSEAQVESDLIEIINRFECDMEPVAVSVAANG